MSLRKSNRQIFKLINDGTKIKQRLNQLFYQKEFKHVELYKTKLGLKMLELVSKGMVSHETIKAMVPPNSKRIIKEDLIEALMIFQDHLDEIEKITIGNEVMQLQLLDIAMQKQ